jgi:hypothetical protein
MIDKLKVVAFDNYYKHPDTFNNFLFTEPNKLLIDRHLPSKKTNTLNFYNIEGYKNDNIIQDKSEFEFLLGTHIINIESKIIVINHSFKLEGDSIYGIVFLNQDIYTRNGIIFKNQYMETSDVVDKRDFITAKNNRICIFKNKYCQTINIIDKMMIEIIKIDIETT